MILSPVARPQNRLQPVSQPQSRQYARYIVLSIQKDHILHHSQFRNRPNILLSPIASTEIHYCIPGMGPMEFFPGDGTEFIRPIGQTVVGGLTVSTLITLFITPVMYSILNTRIRPLRPFRRKEKKRRDLNTLREEILS